jgi:PIN domain nuclease of toxin-antitoxin system
LKAVLGVASIHAVQVAEAARVLGRSGFPSGWLAASLESLRMPVLEELSLEEAYATAEFDVQGLSLGDRICLAVARSRGLIAVTADRRWLEVCDAHPAWNLRVRLIR